MINIINAYFIYASQNKQIHDTNKVVFKVFDQNNQIIMGFSN